VLSINKIKDIGNKFAYSIFKRSLDQLNDRLLNVSTSYYIEVEI